MKLITDEIIEDAVKIEATISQEDLDRANRDRMVELMLTHNITIPARQFDNWRPTELTLGHIEGISDGLTCIMTDGLLGYFLRTDREPLLGHVAHFIWDTAKVTFVKYIDPDTKEEKFVRVTTKRGAPRPWAHKEPPSKVKKIKPLTKRQQLINSI